MATENGVCRISLCLPVSSGARLGSPAAAMASSGFRLAGKVATAAFERGPLVEASDPAGGVVKLPLLFAISVAGADFWLVEPDRRDGRSWRRSCQDRQN